MTSQRDQEWHAISRETEANRADLQRNLDRMRLHTQFLLDQIAVLTTDPPAQRLLGPFAKERIQLIKSELCPAQPASTAVEAR